MGIYITNNAGNKVKIAGLGVPGPAGKSAYQYAVDGGFTGTEEAFSTLMGTQSNPNLLVNWDFLVNRNGKTHYEGHIYGVDRFKGYIGTVVDVVDEGISITGNFVGQIQGSILRGVLTGKIVTLSALVKGDSATIGEVNGTVSDFPASENFALIKHTFVYRAGSNLHEYCPVVTPNPTSGTIIVKAMKLELGSNQTLAYQNESGEWEIIDPPDYDLQYALCAQYSPITGEWIGSQHSNTNLLDNAYWANKEDVINQKGQEEYTGTGYAIDRWTIRNAKMQIMNDGIVLDLSSGNGAGCNQSLEFPSRFVGKTVTLSILLDENTVNGHLRFGLHRAPNSIGHSSSNLIGYISEGKTGLVSITGVVGALGSYSHLNFGICYDSGAAGSIKIRAMKLELGPVQTLAHQDEDGNWVLNDPPPNKALELAKCQRYYWESDMPFSFIGTGVWYSPVNIKFPVKMRETPAVTITSHLGTPERVSFYANGADVEEILAVNANGSYLTDEGFNAIECPSMFVLNTVYIFKVIANANL